MMRGLYRIKADGNIIEQGNVITTIGKARVLDSVSGRTSGFAGAIAAGIGTTTPTINDKALEYLVGGGDVTVSIPDYVNEKIYIKTSLPARDQYEIHELGCFSTNYASVENPSNGGSILLKVFGSTSQWTAVTGSFTMVTTNNRIGADSIQYAINNTTVIGNASMVRDLSDLISTSTFDFAYYANDLSNLLVRFKVDDLNYYEGSFSVTNGYNISKISKGSFAATGSPDWKNINLLEVEATSTLSTGLVVMDAIRYSTPSTADSTLLSRAVLITPQTKLMGVSMDIEYVLSLGV